MLTLYTGWTQDGRKVSITLEELGVPYEPILIDVRKGEQNAPSFRAVNPNGKIPAILDDDTADGEPLAVFESAAILIYLAEKHGRLLPHSTRERFLVLEWTMFQSTGLGPMAAQGHHFRRAAPEQIPYAINRYEAETRRAYGVMDKRLADHEFLAGDYSIADISCFPWVSLHHFQSISLDEYPNLARWFGAIGARPAVVRGMNVPKSK